MVYVLLRKNSKYTYLVIADFQGIVHPADKSEFVSTPKPDRKHQSIATLRAMTEAGNTILIHFQVDPSVVKNREKTQSDLLQLLEIYLGELSPVQSLTLGGGFLILCTGAHDAIVTVRGFVEGMISINMDYFRVEGQEPIFTSSQESEMIKNIAKAIGSQKYESLPVIKRGSVYDVIYGTRSDEQGLVLEYNIEEIIFREKSPFQEVVIAQSPSFGNMLFLDGIINHSSKDLIYTETLILKGKEDYQNKEILILGGGDGSTLCEILKESPKFVVMVEIDEVVIRACRDHLRDVNNGVFDTLKGPNYEVIIGDGVKYLNTYIDEGRKFDYVFGCLSDFPYHERKSTLNHSNAFSLKNAVMRLSFNALKPKGKYMTHCAQAPDTLKAFEDVLLKMDEPVEFTTDVAFVPSFVEFWRFYQIWKKNE